MQIKTITDLNEARAIWEQLVDIKTLYDEWEIKTAFHNNNYPVYSLVAYEGDELVGFLPMQYNTDKNYLEFLGGNFMEYNRVYTKTGYDYIYSELIASIQDKVNLSSIIVENIYTRSLPFLDNTYNLDIGEMQSSEDYFILLSSKSRRSFRKKLRVFETVDHTIEFNRYTDLKRMIELNKIHFGEESTFNDSSIEDAFHKLLNGKLKVHMISILINDIPESIAYSIEHNDTYYYLMSGTNRESLPNLGNYLVINTLKYAIENKFKIYDAGRNDCNWKERWHLTPNPLYVFRNFDVN